MPAVKQRESEIVIVRTVADVELRVVARIARSTKWKGCVVGGRGAFAIDFVGLLGSCSAPGSARRLSDRRGQSRELMKVA